MPTVSPALISRLCYVAFGALLLADGRVTAQEPQQWKTGAAFQQQLDKSGGITWHEEPLRKGLERLSSAYGLAIFLDRRIDPSHPISLKLRDEPVGKVLEGVAKAAGAEMTTLGPIVFLGPAPIAAQLPILSSMRRQDIAKVPTEARARLLRSAAWQWGELAQPRQLLDDLSRQASVSVQDADVIPLDLWPALSLPSLAWCDRMTILLAGFGLTFEIDARGSSIRLVPIPSNLPSGQPPAPQTASRQPRGPKAGDQKVYTLKVENAQAGNVVKSIVAMIGKELKYDPSVVEKLQQQVSLNVKDVPVEQLLETTLKPVGLTYRLTGTSLEILEAP